MTHRYNLRSNKQNILPRKKSSNNQRRYNLRSRKKKKEDISRQKNISLKTENKLNQEIDLEKLSAFENSTISPLNFSIENVIGDNACFYRAVANILYYYTGEISFQEIKHQLWSIKPKGEKLGFLNELQEHLAREVQTEIVEWIYKNQNKKVEELGGLTVSELVIHTHQLDGNNDILLQMNVGEQEIKKICMDAYYERYSVFAGDDLMELDERWAGASEQYALSQILRIPVYTYIPKKYNLSRNSIENGKITTNNNAESGVRLKLFQIFGAKYICSRPSIHLIYKTNTRLLAHYMSLYPEKMEI
jgi:hypothetical protein